MKITRTSPITGKTHTMDLAITPEQMRDFAHGVLIQRAFPDLTPPEREFVKTGITPQEWDTMFAGLDE